MGLDTIETEMVERFRQTLLPGEATGDFFLALGYFRALGLSEGRCHEIAEHVSTSEQPGPSG